MNHPNRSTSSKFPALLVLEALLVLAAAAPAQDRAAAKPPNAGLRLNLPFEAVQKRFVEPDMLYAPFIFWFWDEPLRADKMAEMAQTLAGQGFNPGYAHARKSMVGTPDLPVADWLGDPWFASFDAALKQAEARRAYLGFCDEYWWPSFQAGGRVLESRPELEAQSLRWDCLDVSAGSKVNVPASFFSVAAELDQPLASLPRLHLKMGSWIWPPDSNETVASGWFRKTFDIPAGRKVVEARFKITVDDAFDLYLNGKKIGQGDNWQKPGLYDLAGLLRPGRNVLAVEGRNTSGPFGLLAGMAIGLDDGRALDFRSDKTWLTLERAARGWEALDFDDSSWKPAREIAPAEGGPWRYVTDRIDHVPAVIRSGTLRLIGQGAPFAWQAPAEGSWRVYVFNIYHHAGADGSKVNYIDSRLAPEFIRIALEPYARRYPDRLGRSIPGDFIDNEGDYGWGLAWSATLDGRYRSRYGRDIRLWLPLSVDRDAEGVFARARWEWFDLISDIYAETFRAVTDWNESHGLSTTAHFWEEGIQPQLNAVGDHLKLLRALTMPGQDCLGHKALRVHDFKETESVAEFGNRRAATELMGAASFDGTPWSTFNPVFLKQAVNSVTAWGMSHIIPHGVFTTRKLEGNPWPPDWYSENPMFPYLHHWTDFARRACFVNSLGQAAPDVLLYNPIESAWVQAEADMLDVEMWSFSDERPGGKRINEIDRSYARAIDDLTAARVEFLIGDRHYLAQMEVKDGALALGSLRFRTLVLPPLDILPLDAARKILDFARAGGRVYALAELPRASAEAGMDDPRMKALMDDLRGRSTFAVCPAAGLAPLLDPPAPGLESPVRFAAGAFPMLQQRRRIDGRDFFWLANNTGEWRESRVTVAGVRGAAAIWDCETGTTRPLASSVTGEGSLLGLVFKPYEAYWLVFDPDRPPHSGAPWRKSDPEVVVSIEGPWTVTCDPKIQPVLEFPVTPSVDLVRGAEKQLEDWRAWGLGKFSGLLDYSKTVTVSDLPGRDLWLDLGKVCHVAEVWVNGRSCGSRLWGPHMFDVGQSLRQGSNEIRVRVANLVGNSYGETEESGLLGPVRLVRVKEH